MNVWDFIERPKPLICGGVRVCVCAVSGYCDPIDDAGGPNFNNRVRGTDSPNGVLCDSNFKFISCYGNVKFLGKVPFDKGDVFGIHR
jgi:hypothetical protein